jgi:hypothetical protein
MKLLFVLLSLTFAAQSFAFGVYARKSGWGYYVVCANGNSGGQFATWAEGKAAGADLCRGRGEITSKPTFSNTVVPETGFTAPRATTISNF